MASPASAGHGPSYQLSERPIAAESATHANATTTRPKPTFTWDRAGRDGCGTTSSNAGASSGIAPRASQTIFLCAAKARAVSSNRASASNATKRRWHRPSSQRPSPARRKNGASVIDSVGARKKQHSVERYERRAENDRAVHV